MSLYLRKCTSDSQFHFRMNPSNLEIRSGLVHTALRLCQHVQRFTLIFWLIPEKNHMPVSIANMLAILKAVLKDILDYYTKLKMSHILRKYTWFLIQSLSAINMQDMYWILFNAVSCLLQIDLNIRNGRLACHYCPTTFKTTGEVNRHMMIHTGEKPFVCHFCNDAFNRKSNLQRHIRLKHGANL